MKSSFAADGPQDILLDPSRSLRTLPYHSLSPMAFEFFVAELIDRLPEFTSVQNYGAFPDNQHGVDIVADRAEVRWAFQCKRYQHLRPSDFQKVLKKAANFSADHFVLALSRPARPNLIEAVRLAGWDLWDSDELDRRTRSLDEPFNLVEGYFGRATAKAFLGKRKPGIFLAPEEYFAPYLRPGRAENLQTPLVNRVEEFEAAYSFLTDATASVMLISGRSGVGKTKLLYELSKSLPNAGRSMRLAREAGDLDDDALDELPVSTEILVVDDVRGIARIEGVASAALRSNFKLLLVVRSGDEVNLMNQLQEVGYNAQDIARVAIKHLSPSFTAELVGATLAGDFKPLLPAIQKLSSGIPIVIQVITYLISAGQSELLEALSGKDYPVAILFARYADVLAGQISEAQACPKADVLDLLRLMAAVGPRDIRTSDFRKVATRFLQWDSVRLSTTVKALEQSGVLLRLGSKSRITPELLALYILRDVCTPGSVRSDFAERILRRFGYDRQILINFATACRMDETVELALRPVWAYIKAQVRRASAFQRVVILDELDDLGYMLPSLMLDIVDFVMLHPPKPDPTQPLQALHRFDQPDVLRKLPGIIRSVARTGEFLERCVDVLWKLGRDEERRFGQDSAFEVLVNLARYERYKPVGVLLTILNEVEKINARAEEQQYRHLPIEIAAPALAKSYESIESSGAKLTIQRMGVDVKYFAPARAKAIDIMAMSLNGASPRAASKSAGYLIETLTGLGHQSSTEAQGLWAREVDRVLDLLVAMQNDDGRGLLKAQVAGLLSWHAQVNSNPHIRKRVSQIIAGLEGTPEFDWYAALTPDIARHMPSVKIGADFEQLQVAIDALLDRVVDRIHAEHWEPSALAQAVADSLHETRTAGLNGGAGWLFITLSRRDLKYAKDVVDIIIADLGSDLGDVISPVIFAAWSTDIAWVDTAVARSLATGEQKLFMGVAQALWMHRGVGVENVERDADRRSAIIASLVRDGNKDVKEVALRAVGTLLSINRSKGIELILSLDVGEDTSAADELFANLRSVSPGELGEHGVYRMLTYLTTIQELDYWAMEFLRQIAKERSDDVLDTLLRRIERSADLPTQLGGFRPVPYGHVIVPHEVQFFDQLNCSPNALKGALDRGFALNHRGRHWFAELISNVARKPQPLLQALETWIADGSAERLHFAAEAIHRIPADAIFDNADFVVALIERAACLDEETRLRVTSALFSAATTGLRSGVAFQPMPQDVAMIEHAKGIASTLTPGSAAYNLFDEIVRYGEDSITKKLEADIDTFGEPE